MVVDDLVVCGAEPLFMTDYVVCGAVQPERVAAIVGGVAEGCVQAGCALIGGETAEHPGHLAPDDFDLAGAATGVVEADKLLGPDRVRAGDVLIAMASSGLHSNGFSLVRKVIDQPGRPLALDSEPAGLGRSLGAELLAPTRIYSRMPARCTRSRTSPGEGWPRTSAGCCLPAPAPRWTGAAGRSRRCSGCWRRTARWKRPRWNACSTWASA
jgi:phosphoribosylaminoimidazole synthetase